MHAVGSYVARFANGYCSRVGGKVRGWDVLALLLITWRSFANLAYYQLRTLTVHDSDIEHTKYWPHASTTYFT